MMDVTILLLHGGHSSTAVAPLEVFHSTGVLWNYFSGEGTAAPFRVQTASVDGKPVQAEGPLRVAPQTSLRGIRRTDLIFVPSGGVDLDGMIARHRPALSWLRKWRKKGAYIAGVCSGVALLAAAGLLDGRRATTHWGLVERYRQRFPRVDWRPDLFVTEDNGIFCGGGVYSSLDLSLYLVEKFCGHDVAVQCAKALLVEMPRTFQTGFSLLPLGAQHADESIRSAEEWIHQNYHRDFRLEDLAQRVGMSPRNFIRRFKAATGQAPLTYLQRLRIAAAKRLLEIEDRTVEGVSQAVGYEDVAFFRNLFKRHTGVAPNLYRRSFGISNAATRRTSA